MSKLKEKFQAHPVLEEEIKRPELGAPALKHLLQNSSLISLMEDRGLLKDNTCFVEMGAGKGISSKHLKKTLVTDFFLILRKTDILDCAGSKKSEKLQICSRRHFHVQTQK
jgi:Methyltransferase TRM13